MKFVDDVKKHLTKADLTYIFGVSTVASLITSAVPFIFGDFATGATTALSAFAVSFLTITAVGVKCEKEINKIVINQLIGLEDIIENDQLDNGNRVIDVKHTYEKNHITYFFGIGKYKLIELTYDISCDFFTNTYIDRHMLKKENGKTYFAVGELKKMIQNAHRREKTVVEAFSLDVPLNVSVETFSDEITEGIDTLHELSLKLSSDSNMLSLEERHLVNETIPGELVHLKNIYLSFTDETKLLRQDKVKDNMVEIKNALASLRENVEAKKVEQLSKVEHRIREKITKRI